MGLRREVVAMCRHTADERVERAVKSISERGPGSVSMACARRERCRMLAESVWSGGAEERREEGGLGWVIGGAERVVGGSSPAAEVRDGREEWCLRGPALGPVLELVRWEGMSSMRQTEKVLPSSSSQQDWMVCWSLFVSMPLARHRSTSLRMMAVRPRVARLGICSSMAS